MVFEIRQEDFISQESATQSAISSGTNILADINNILSNVNQILNQIQDISNNPLLREKILGKVGKKIMEAENVTPPAEVKKINAEKTYAMIVKALEQVKEMKGDIKISELLEEIKNNKETMLTLLGGLNV